ncbi:hypothetical protein C8J57DRAFT_1577132 [Mycena rebaudengoi]|nr:hypothetical protein C8J57DRAFT_1577132 [Mycena rebaudengoi]
MTKNRDEFEELCESIVEIVTMLQEKISRHGINATSSLQLFCEELEHLLQEIQQKLGEIQPKQKKGLRRHLKEFVTSTSIGDELARYKTRLKRLRNNFMLSSMAQLNINANASVPQSPPPPVTTRCPPPSRIFRGRKDILEKMHDYFSQDVGIRHVCLLHGLGGSGKTQICLKFLAETNKSRFTDVFFLDASTINTIKSGLKNIALTRSIGSEHEDASCWLSSREDEWLVIFDNADDPTINLFNYFPQSSCGNILITSRNPRLHVHAPDAHHQISDMEDQDAVELLLASAAEPYTTETEILATEIVKALHCFALAVVQAGAFIAQTGKLRKYLTLYEQNHAQLLSRLAAQSHDKYAWSVYTTWDLSFNSLGPEQIKEPREFLQNFLTQIGAWDELRFTDITTEIQAYSLINQDPNTSLLSIHPLVHDWSRNTILDADSTQVCTAAILAMSAIYNDQVFMIKLLPHINSVLHNDPLLAHKFPYPYQRVYYDSGDLYKAQELCTAFLEDRKHTLGNEHPDTLLVMQQLTATYWELGKFTDAEELCAYVHKKMEQILGPEHPSTLDAMANLAGTYLKLRKFTDAEKLYISVLDKRQEMLGTEHPDTLAAIANLAHIYRNLGKLTDAEELHVYVLEKRQRILGPEHPETLDSMGNLAHIYRELGKFTDAEELEVSVLEKTKQILGPEHPRTLVTMGNLALLYRDLGKYSDAEELQVPVLEKRKHILGPDHPNTLDAMLSLALIYGDLGKSAEAEQLQLTVVEKMEHMLGIDDPETLLAMEHLAGTYRELGKCVEAEHLNVSVLEKRKQILGLEHHDTLDAMGNLASTYWKLEKFEDAEELEVSVLEKRKKILGPDHPITLEAMANLAATYGMQEKFSEAEELQVSALEKRKRILGPEHPDTLDAMENLALTYRNLGKFMQAEQLG